MGVEQSELLRSEQILGFPLPNEYREFLGSSDGLTEMLQNSYLVLWPLAEVTRINGGDEYDLAASMPHFLAIGSDGGGEVVGFDMRTQTPSVVLVNAVSMTWDDAHFQSTSLTDLLHHLRAGGSLSFDLGD